MRPKRGTVYILANRRLGTLYVGVTSDLGARIRQHKDGTFEGFTTRYDVTRLVYFETHDRVVDAIAREKAIKKWRRAWKVELIESVNPEWLDLYNARLGTDGGAL